MKQVFRITKIILFVLLVWFISHSIFISIDGLNDNYTPSDIAVILGNKVNKDGTLSERLKKRLECGISLYNNHQIKKIIVSGGLGKEGHYEGDKMKYFLIENGIPDSTIIVDNKGNNTIATVENVLKLKDSLHYNSIIIVSQYFHISRTTMLFKKRGFVNVSSASPKYFELRDFYSIIREFFAYYKEC